MYPKKGSVVQYDKKKCESKYSSPVSIIGFADFETKLCLMASDLQQKTKCYLCRNKTCPHVSYTKQIESHKLISYSLIFTDAKSTLLFEKHYCGPKIEENFFTTLMTIEEQLLIKSCSFKGITFMKPLTKDERIEF